MEFGETRATSAERVLGALRVIVLISRRQHLGKDWCFDLRSPFWRLYVNDRSGAYVHHGGYRMSLGKNIAWVIPAWMHFQTSLQKPCTQDFIHFQVVGPLARPLETTLTAPTKLGKIPATSAIIEQWRSGLEIQSFSSMSWATAAAHAVLSEVFFHWTPEKQESWQLKFEEPSEIQAALTLMEMSPKDPPTNRQLAEVCVMSEDHFIRKFRAATGSTPAEYGRHHRVLLAAEMLAGSNRTIDDIAESAGFTDRFHLSRLFKNQLGFPPATYRRMHRLDQRVAINDESQN